MTTLLQEVKCPHCGAGWDLHDDAFVSHGDTLQCRSGCAPFVASSETVTCCMEDMHGMVQLALRAKP